MLLATKPLCLVLFALLGAAALVHAAPTEEEFFASSDFDEKLAAAAAEDGEISAELLDESDRILDEAVISLGGCCIDNPDRPLSPASLSGYDCSQLTTFGPDRCKAAFEGAACSWTDSRDCARFIPRRCTRTPKYEVHFGKRIDVGQCRGFCLTSIDAVSRPSCTPRDTVPMDVNGNTVMVIKSCECSTCATAPKNIAVEIPASVCTGRCADELLSRTCTAGVADNFSNANGAEPSSPSVALLTGPLTGCSAGIQSGFDIFADNRCFGHTFDSRCIVTGRCPIRRITVNFCLRAAAVSLTSTDGLALGSNGVLHWGIGLPALNNIVSGSNSWNMNAQLCTTLDLTNLPPGGANIVPLIESAGQLDFFVQDDTAVDFIRVNVDYVDCQVCAPKVSVVSTLYTQNGVQNFVDVKDCECVDTTECHREPLYQTLFPNTIFEATIDVGQCIGRCGTATLTKCRPAYSSKKELKAPEGIRVVEIIEKCDCF